MLLALFLLQAAPTASGAALPPQPVQAQTQEEKICKRIRQAGSNLARKTCLTQAEWANQAAIGRDKAETANRPF